MKLYFAAPPLRRDCQEVITPQKPLGTVASRSLFFTTNITNIMVWA
jgi:hypothetical protein